MKPSLSTRVWRAHHQFGYTLLELMVGLSIAAIMMMVALPSFAKLVSKNTVITQSNAVLESLHFARTHALSQNYPVHLCQLNTGEDGCENQYNANQQWTNGWLIFVDRNQNNSFEPEELLRVVITDRRSKIVFNQTGRLRFFSDGSARSAGFYVCQPGFEESRHVHLLHTGRARVVDELSDTKLERCLKA